MWLEPLSILKTGTQHFPEATKIILENHRHSLPATLMDFKIGIPAPRSRAASPHPCKVNTLANVGTLLRDKFDLMGMIKQARHGYPDTNLRTPAMIHSQTLDINQELIKKASLGYKDCKFFI
jgi:hypothetical protein